jgi:hypothetical protein
LPFINDLHLSQNKQETQRMNNPQNMKVFLSALGVPEPFHQEIIKATCTSVVSAIMDSAVREAWLNAAMAMDPTPPSTMPELDYPTPGSAARSSVAPPDKKPRGALRVVK